MTENIRYVAGHMELTDQLLEASREVEAAIERHRQRMESDPEYAAEYLRELAERLLDDDDWDD